MLTFKFFVFVSIVGYFISSLKKLKQDNTGKNKISVIVSFILLLFGIYMLVDAK